MSEPATAMGGSMSETVRSSSYESSFPLASWTLPRTVYTPCTSKVKVTTMPVRRTSSPS